MGPLSSFHLPDLSKASILIVGDIMLDSYLSGDTSRLSPEAPVPIVNVTSQSDRVGGAGNVSLNLAAFNSLVTLVSVTGQDAAASSLASLLSTSPVNYLPLSNPDWVTTHKLRILSRSQQVLRVDTESIPPLSEADWSAICELYASCLNDCNVIILSDYAKGALPYPQDLIRLASDSGKHIVVDPKGVCYAKYRGSSILTPNYSEFLAVVGHCLSEDDVVSKGFSLVDQLSLQALLITRGPDGMTLLERGKKPLTIPTAARQVFDVTGAGDTVIATLAACVSCGLPYSDAAYLSNLAASVSVSKLGAYAVSSSELYVRYFSRAISSDDKIYTPERLKCSIDAAKSSGLKVVMTNGCFDLLHPGHIDYLRKARSLGDLLFVAVNDDCSVRRLKGPSRPINNLSVRISMLLGLESVDGVIAFSEDTPEQLYSLLLPSILVKGGDYTLDRISGASSVIAAGGDVVIVDYLPGFSSSSLISSIKQSA